jgi:hypothetical protein
MKPPVKNVGASVRARLTDRARAGKEDAQLLFARYAIERLLYAAAKLSGAASKAGGPWTSSA